MYIGIIIALITVIICFIICTGLKHKIKFKNEEVEKTNIALNAANTQLKIQHDAYTEQCKELKEQINDLNRDASDKTNDYSVLLQKLNICQSQVDMLTQQEEKQKERLKTISENAEALAKSQTDLVSRAFENYCNNLESQYSLKEKEYSELEDLLEQSYTDKQDKLYKDTEELQINLQIKKEQMQAEADEAQKELEKIRSTRAAAIEALRREKEIMSDSSFYCIPIADDDKADIQRLNSIKKTLNKPRVLSMLIWSTYYQKALKQLAANILGSDIVTGIYKITNIITGEVYIGQSVDIAKRWSEHAKCGLDIDTPPGNKLYKAMIEYGLYSFSWELLEKCPPAELNEKERFYINLYDSATYGYNITVGNKN